MKYEIVAGWTAPVDINLLTKGAAPSGTMIGFTAAIVIADIEGNVIDTTGDVTIPDPNVWSVRYSPDPTDLVTGVYRMRVKVTDSFGRIAYFPSGVWDELVVRDEV